MRLRSYLFLLILVAVLPMVGFSVMTVVSLFQQQHASITRGLVHLARAISVAVDRELNGSIDTLHALAASEHLDTGALARFDAQAKRVLWRHKSWSTVSLADASGQTVVDLLRAPDAALPFIGDREFFREVLASHRAVISDLAVDGSRGGGSLSVAVPVVRGQQVRYVLIAEIQPATFALVLASQRPAGDGTVSLLDRRRIFVAHAPRPERLVGTSAPEALARRVGAREEGVVSTVTGDGASVYTGFHRSALSGWTVAVGAPRAVVDAVLGRWLWRVGIVGLGLLALGLGAAWWFERRLRLPITAMSRSARAIARGTPLAPLPASPIAEVASLASAIEHADLLLRERAKERDRVEAELADQREQFRVTLTSIGDAVIATDEAGSIRFVNRVAQALLGRSAAELVGRPLDDGWLVVDEVSRTCLESPVARVIRDGVVVEMNGQPLLVGRDGAEIPIAGSMAPRRDAGGRPRGAVLVFRDITERRRAERERAELLERAQGARRDAEAANRSKDEFLAMLGHELRNPLGAIANAAYVLDLVGGAEPPAAQARQIIARQVKHVARMVDDLLDVARLTAGKIVLDRRAVNLAEAVTRCLHDLSAAGKTPRHRIALETEPVWAHADATRVEQIMANLVLNAVKHTPPDGSIRITVGPADGEARIRVEDTGVGIPPESLSRIFELFQQGPQTLARLGGGLGIGLTLVRRLVELHGGQIEAASEGPGRGSTFTVRLPRLPMPLPVLAPAPVADETAARRRILLVEDSQDAREMLRAYLAHLGHDVLEAEDGPRGVQAALRFRPDAAIIDIGLPGLNGYEVARRIRGVPHGEEMLLVALTGYGQPSDRALALEAGFDAHLVKPFDRDRLAALLARAPQRAGAAPG